MGVFWRIVLGVFLLGLVYFLVAEPHVRCWWFRHELLSALDDAASVRMVEHSSRFDHLGYNPDYKEITFATVTLTPGQIEALRKALPLTVDYSGSRMKMCMFEEHHYIAITRHDGSVLILHICFHCGQIELGKRYGDMPEGWDASLRTFVSSIGLHPDGPWGK